MSVDESVHRSMSRKKFSSHVQESFFVTMVNSGLPLLFFVAVFCVCIYTRSLYKTGYMVAGLAACISIAYTVWYFVSYLCVYVILYIQKIVLSIFGKKPVGKML